MKNRKGQLMLLVGVFVVCCLSDSASMVLAADISIGGGLGLAPDYEGSENYDLVPIPFADVRWNNGMFVNLEGYTMRANLIPSDFWRLGLMANYRPQRSNVENNQVDNLENVEAALEVGPFVGIQFKNWNASVEVTTDAIEGHDGTLFAARIGYNWVASDSLTILFGSSTTYASNDYMATYFSVEGFDIISSGLPEYKADAGLKDVGINLGISYGINDSWSARGIASYTRLVGDAEDSPVVDDAGDANQFFAGLLVVYTFGEL